MRRAEEDDTRKRRSRTAHSLGRYHGRTADSVKDSGSSGGSGGSGDSGGGRGGAGDGGWPSEENERGYDKRSHLRGRTASIDGRRAREAKTNRDGNDNEAYGWGGSGGRSGGGGGDGG